MGTTRVVRGTEGAEVSPWTVKTAGSDNDDRFDFMVGTIDYLTGPPLHVHAAQDDTFYVLEGVLTVQSGDEVIELVPGDFVSVPPGVPHTFDNLHPDQPPVRAINIMTPGGYAKAIDEFNELGAGITDLARAREVGRRHGVEIVGPPLREKLGLGAGG
jgi:quercetin dioxygenase-like cupin family protein